jgi:NTP pyrophosphatase (non-canonical NTP hydrolase)
MNNNNDSFSNLYLLQMQYQNAITGEVVPEDDVKWFSYHIQAMVEELGELMKSDKRWKNIRNERYDKEEKLDELSDCFITLMNIAMYSGFYPSQVQEAIYNKIEKNFKR